MIAFSASVLSANDLQQLTQLATQGDADAQIKLAEYYGDTTKKHLDSKKSFEWYQKAAAQGNILAKRRLGNCYIQGQGVKENPDKAQELWNEAAQAGDIAAAYNLGMFFHGKGGGPGAWFPHCGPPCRR